MRLKILIVLILLNILIPIKIYAEMPNNASFEKISIDEGLSNEEVTTIFQDSKGYMWIGTKDGLNRYDGEQIKIYNCNVEDKNTLSSTYINDIEEDIYGNIWIATDHGLDFLIRDTDTVKRMKDRKDIYNLGNMKITSLLKSSYDKNIIWVGTENGLMKINVKNKSVKAFYYDENNLNSLTSSSITCLEEDENNTLWVGTRKGINLIDKNSDIYRSENLIYDDRLFISHLSKDNSGNIWISTKQGIYKFNVREGQDNNILIINNRRIEEYNLKEKTTINIQNLENSKEKFYDNLIFIDSKNNKWFSSSRGAVRFSNDTNQMDTFGKYSEYKHSMTSNVITCYYEDSNGTIWIGTDKGANILNSTIFNYTKNTDKNIVGMLLHNGFIWIATKFNGIYIYDSETGELLYNIYEEEGFSFKDRYIKDFFEIDENNILIVTNKDIICFNTKEHSYKEILIGNDYSIELKYIYNDGEDIWIATTADFYRYNIKSKETRYYSQDLMYVGINPGDIKYILQDNEDEEIIWLGGIGTGLVKYHKEKGVMKRYTNDSLTKGSLINNYINCMAFDDSGNLWIGTNIGLSKLNIKTNKFTSYTTSQGLTNNFINSILLDDNNDIWISTNKGLNKFDVDQNKFIKFTEIDGLNGYQFNLNSYLKLKTGTIILGTTEGCIYFNPDDLASYKTYKNDVVIGDIYVGKNKTTYNGKELVLEHDYKDLSIDYFLPNYENLNNTTYEYMLDGIDTDWTYIGSESNLNFKSLESGKYILKIRARDGHGELTKETSINIKVKKPIWRTPLAYIIYIFILGGIFFWIFNYVKILKYLVNQKTINLNKQLEENQRLNKEIIEHEKFKNNYFVNLSHELRTPINIVMSTVQLINSRITNNNITYEKINEYMDIISKSCDNLLKIINDILDSSKIETGQYKIHKKNNDIVYVVEEAALNMRKYIEDKGLSLIIDPDMEEQIVSCDATEIERCVVNLLANAVKFTPESGEVRVYIKEVENNIEITVEDTGIGISKEDQEFIFKRFSQVDGTGVTKSSSSGIGLTLVKYVAELHGGYIRLESELNKGSKFTIGLPNIVEDNSESMSLI